MKYSKNTVIYNNKKEPFIIKDIFIENNTRMFLIESINTHYTTSITFSALYSHKFDDKLQSHNKYGTVIGYANTFDYYKEYQLWNAMWRRCVDSSSNAYKWYGANGVTVCDRWKRFDLFLEDLSNIKGYNKELFIKGELFLDKDKSGNKLYSAESCEFVTRTENMCYTRKSKCFYAINDESGIKQKFDNIKTCAETFNLDSSCVAKCLLGKRKTTKGFHFVLCNANDYRKGNSQVE